MPRRLLNLVIAPAIAGILIADAPAAVAHPNVSHFKLENGLEVVVIPDCRAPVVTHMLWYKVGSADEPPGKSGIAHFLEHLMFKGTEKNPAGRFSKELSAIGGQENAFTSSDYTGYFQRTAREHLRMLMEFEADRMTGLVLTEEAVRLERDVVLEERNERVDNNPGSRLGEQLDAALYLNHPYGRPVIGWRHEIEKLSREDALEFYRDHYAPNNAVLVVAGDVTAEEVRKLAEATYGRIPSSKQIRARQRPQEPEHAAPRRISLADARVQQPSMQRYYLVPSSSTAQPGESEALSVMTSILGSGATSRLYRSLVVDQGVAVNAGAWYSGSSLDRTRLAIYASPRPGVTLPQLEKAVDGVIEEIIAKGVDDSELQRAKNRLIADAVFAQDSQRTMARWYGVALTTGSTVKDVQTWADRIRAVTAKSVQAAAKTWLDQRRSATGYLFNDKRQEDNRS